jgi:hypothetical protein
MSRTTTSAVRRLFVADVMMRSLPRPETAKLSRIIGLRYQESRVFSSFPKNFPAGSIARATVELSTRGAETPSGTRRRAGALPQPRHLRPISGRRGYPKNMTAAGRARLARCAERSMAQGKLAGGSPIEWPKRSRRSGTGSAAVATPAFIEAGRRPAIICSNGRRRAGASVRPASRRDRERLSPCTPKDLGEAVCRALSGGSPLERLGDEPVWSVRARQTFGGVTPTCP